MEVDRTPFVNPSAEFERPDFSYQQGKYAGFNPMFAGNDVAPSKAADWNWLSLHFSNLQSQLQAGGALTTTYATLTTAQLYISSMTQGSVLFAGAGGLISQNNSSLFWDNTNTILRVTGGTKNLPAFLGGASNGNTDFWVQFGAMPTWTNANMSGGGNWHSFADMTISSANNIGSASYDAIPQFIGTGDFTDHASFESRPTMSSSGTMGTLYGLFWRTAITAGTITDLIGVDIGEIAHSGGAVGTHYGVRIRDLTFAGTNWGIYVDGTTKSFFNANVGFSTLTPRRQIDILNTVAPQLRLTYADNSVYCDWQVDSGGNVIFSSNSAAATLTMNSAGSGAGVIAGNAKVGVWGLSSAYAVFGHNSVTASAQAVEQSSGGYTQIGAAAGQLIAFYNNNSTFLMSLATNAILFANISTGFFGAAAVARQTVGANVNNVAASGTTGQFDDFTDGVVYATDYASLHNTIYQLTLSVAQLTVAVRNLGLGA